MRIGCIIQARIGSTRLPNKINADIGGRTMLWHVVNRVEKISGLNLIILAMPGEFPELNENDVLGRYILCARREALDAIMRVTSDCPLIDPNACQLVLERFLRGFDYCANDWRAATKYPDGMGCEVFSMAALKYADAFADPKNPADREHVTPWIVRACQARQMEGSHVVCPYPRIQNLKFSVDTQEDLDRARAIDAAGPRDFSLGATLEAFERAKINSPAAA